MANPTTNYSFAMPTNTDLVKDLPADFEVFGQAVDTKIKDLNPETTAGDISYRASTANAKSRLGIGTARQVLAVNSGATAPEWVASASSTLTTTGDVLYASAANTLARLGIGTTGQVLTVASGLPSWGAAPASTQNWSLLNTGGTALTGAGTVTVSGISGKDRIMILISGASAANASSNIQVGINATTANYNYYGQLLDFPSTYLNTTNGQAANAGSQSEFNLGTMGSNAAATVSGFLMIEGCNTAGVKMVFGIAGTNAGGGNGQKAYQIGGFWNDTSTVSSISIRSSSGNLDAGTVFVYATA